LNKAVAHVGLISAAGATRAIRPSISRRLFRG
jgi:hypothetical protein